MKLTAGWCYRDYTVKICSVVHTIMRRVNYTGSQLQNEDQVGFTVIDSKASWCHCRVVSFSLSKASYEYGGAWSQPFRARLSESVGSDATSMLVLAAV